ncbi:hypothetical protein CVIRNUC_007292 [Coccomyxa viridis]|uniref:Uncharacterized protein n=1 Tax=Coccomyxa viridis TaxID=1274662 RepID=A0AAV1IAI1_9CHLO|nr:hypothetical protein CVIRNUC_007292 [Coccomyxa viridis]
MRPSRTGPYNPAPVQVQVSATESPPPSKPPQTNPPSTTPVPTTTPAPPVASCTGQANGVHCNTGSATTIGGRCVSGACQGTPVTFCSGSAKPACKLGAAGRTASFCDPIADPGVLPAGSTGVLEVGTPAAGAGCTTTADCAIGFLCDAFYSGTTAGSAGGCVANC